MARALVFAAMMVVATAGCGGGGARHAEPRTTRDSTVHSAPRPTRASPVTIAAPQPGLATSARSIVVRGRAPWLRPNHGDSLVRVTVNGRPLETFPTRKGYRTPVALEAGPNEIVVHGWAQGFDEDAKVVSGTARVVVQRKTAPGDGTGTLDLATAYMLADSTDKAYWLCGEGDGCGFEPVCFRVGPRRVDCPVASWHSDNQVRRCGHVYTLRLRGDQLYSGFYACHGRLNPRPRQRWVRADFTPRLHRVVINASRDDRDTYRVESNGPNRYGAPRFSMDRDVFLP
jgi:hypothetical protein